MYSLHEIRGLGSRMLRGAKNAVSSFDRLVTHRDAKEANPIIEVGAPRSRTTLAYELLVQAFDATFLARLYGLTNGLPHLTTWVVCPLTRRPSARQESRYGRIPGMLATAENLVLWPQWFDRAAQRLSALLLRRRPGSNVSDRFERRYSSGFPANLEKRFADLRAELSNDSDSYLRRADERVECHVCLGAY